MSKRGNLFRNISAKKPRRNLFDLSHERKFSMNMGDLVPILCEDVVPGDTFKMNTEVFMRLAPMLAPIMHRVNVYTHFFFVPNRLVFDGWEKFITGGVDGKDDTPYPRFNTKEFANKYPLMADKGSLLDYLGVPPLVDSGSGAALVDMELSALPMRAYQLIYNEYYRDQTLSAEVEFSKGSDVPVTDLPNLFQLRKRAWEKDYYTSALPFPQRGGDVMLPLTGNANVYLDGSGVDASNLPSFKGGNTKYVGDIQQRHNNQTGVTSIVNRTDTGVQDAEGLMYDPAGTLKADMGGVQSTTINELRRSVRLQEWLEKNARAGSRYIEQIFSHFGVRSSDARLQRPEYLGGGKSPVTISEVLQTSSTDSTTPQGNMSGHGVAVGNTHGFKRFFEEHGFVIGIMSVIPRTAYQDGVPRRFTKFDRFDHFWPEFANIGEQPIMNKELYCYDTDNNDKVFGYTPRYAEYKYCQSTVHGDFRDNLAFWHMGRKFANLPTLSQEFIESDPTHDIFAVTDKSVHKLYVQIYNNLRAIRPMPVFGTPIF